MSTKFGRLQFSEKVYLNQKLRNINKRKVGLQRFQYTWILNGMEMPWYSMFSSLFCFTSFYFILFRLFRGNVVRRDSWKRATSATAMVIFSKVLFQKLIDHSYVKVSSQKLGGTSTTEFWRTPYGWRFTDMDTC